MFFVFFNNKNAPPCVVVNTYTRCGFSMIKVLLNYSGQYSTVRQRKTKRGIYLQRSLALFSVKNLFQVFYSHNRYIKCKKITIKLTQLKISESN